MNVLVLNAGSSSLKFQIISTDVEQIEQYKDDRICRGEIEGIGGEAILRIRYRQEPARTLTSALHDMGAALDYLAVAPDAVRGRTDVPLDVIDDTLPAAPADPDRLADLAAELGIARAPQSLRRRGRGAVLRQR